MERLTAQDMMELLDVQLRNAQKIQQKIIPSHNTFISSYYSFFSYLQPFRRVGGDFFDFQILEDGCISFILADATGHGIDAAMLTGMVKLIYSYAMRSERVKRSPSLVLKQVNDDIEKLIDFSFFSGVALFFDPHNNKLYWNNAGHPAAFLISQNNEVIQLQAELPLIGMHSMFGKIDYSDYEIEFKKGDKLILYTDGLTDGKNINGAEYGVNRIEAQIEKFKHSNIDTLCQVILNDYKEFTAHTDASDDICLLGIQYDNE